MGSSALIYFAAAGVGTIGVVDVDVVELSNLQRQVVHGVGDVGRLKSASAAQRLESVNPLVQVVRHDVWIDAANALEIIADYDLVLDGTDNFPTRYLLNDACVLLGKPDIWGSIYRFDGQTSIWWARHGPCYRCVFPEPPPPGLVPSCAEGGGTAESDISYGSSTSWVCEEAPGRAWITAPVASRFGVSRQMVHVVTAVRRWRRRGQSAGSVVASAFVSSSVEPRR